MNENLKEMFENEPITTFKRNKNIPEIIGTYWIENRRVKKDLKSLKEGKCTTCRAKTGNICCEQVKTTATFKSQQITKTWKIFHCETEYVICLMESIIRNQRYVDENETPLSIRLNNHRKDVKDPKAILADKHF